MDAQTIAAAVRDKHGIDLAPDDPAFLLVTMNELVLQAALDDLASRVAQVVAQAHEEIEQMRVHAGAEIGKAVRLSVIALRRELQTDVDAAKIDAEKLIVEIQRTYSDIHVRRWVAAGVVVGVVLLLFGFGAGYLLHTFTIH